MKEASPNTLARALRRFFTDHLPRVRGASSHTIQSYRDAFVLLLRFVAARRRVPVSELDGSLDLHPHAELVARTDHMAVVDLQVQQLFALD